MADAVTTQIINDGDRNVVMKFTNISDATGEADALKVDVSALAVNGNGDACTRVQIERIQGSTEGISVDIIWDATVNVLAHTTPTDEFFDLDYRASGGIPNNSGAGQTGDILFTTTGSGLDDRYTIVLFMIKKYD